MINTTGVVVGIEEKKAFVHIGRHTACENCGACHFDEKTLNMKITAVNEAGAKVGDRVELSMDNVNFFRASFFLYGIPLIALLIGLIGSFYILQNMEVKMYDILSIGIGIVFMTVSFLILKSKSQSFAENPDYMSTITQVIHEGDFPVI